MIEQALDPERAIIDPHLHLWDIPSGTEGLQEPQTFLVPDAAGLIRDSGHRVTHTVYVEAHAMYRQLGPPSLRSLGETEFANGMAAMAASGRYGPCLIAHRIVANIDLCLGDAVDPVLAIHIVAAGERLRGVRMNTAYSPAGLFGGAAEAAGERRLADPGFIRGARAVAQLGLNLDIWCLHPQLPQLTDLARQVPDLPIVLDHIGTPDLRGSFSGREAEAFAEWRKNMTALAEQPNVRIKLSGLAMDVAGPLRAETGLAPSTLLAGQWRDRIAAVIDAFGPGRCMFASNYPADRPAGSYSAIWNAFKRLAQPYSDGEKDRLFRGTAAATYHIDIDDHG